MKQGTRLKLRRNIEKRFRNRKWKHYYKTGLCSRTFVPAAFGPGTIGGFCPGSKGTTTDRAICPGSKGLFVLVLEPEFGCRDKSPGGRNRTKCPSR